MEQLKVCFIGVGSIARRHIRNLTNICEKRAVKLTIDAFRRKNDLIEGVNQIYVNKAELPNNYDVLFITNPTGQHLNSIKSFHNNGTHFFIEKPVVSVDQIEEAKCINLKRDSVYYVAAPLRFNAVIQWIKGNLDPTNIISVRSISSSYLPDWRPGQDYRKTYSAHKDMGGGVSIDLIHEWDYLTYLFGWPEKVFSMIGKKSNLEIDSDDFAIYIAEYEKMIVELHLDYFGRKPIRQVELLTNEDTIVGDIANNKITFMKTGNTIAFDEERDDYQKRELGYFLDMVSGRVDKEDGFHHGLNVLKLTQGKRWEDE